MSQNENVYKEIHLLSLLSLWKSNLSSDMVTHRRCWPVRGNPDSPMRLDSWYSGCYLSIDCMFNFHFLQTSTTGGARVQGEVVRRPNIYRTDLCDPVKSISRINVALLVGLRNICCDSSAYCHEEWELESSTGAYDMGTSLSTTAVYLWLRQR